ncbi:MAG: LPS export ABC transporter periplasmic protein LptC, partial [Acetobacteraceae bacterium]|nr:LPS export ABC transporter periplasmic protein LptC [Acetobacteraceae bacterium]
SRRRRAPTPGALARRRAAIKVVKLLLPALALALLSAIAFWPEIEGGGEGGRVSFRRTVEPRPEALRVVNPRYRGLDEEGRPYTITAAIGQQVGAEEVLDLTEPRGDILLTDGAWIFLRADTGRYDKPNHRLALDGDVTIYHDNGTMLRTAHALVLLQEGSAEGDTPVAAQGGFGTLTAEGFRLTDRGAVVVFTGNARAVLESRP